MYDSLRSVGSIQKTLSRLQREEKNVFLVFFFSSTFASSGDKELKKFLDKRRGSFF